MQYITTYQSPLGEILLAADETGLTGLWFEGEKYYALNLDVDHKERETRLLSDAKSYYLFLRQRTGFYAADAYVGHCISENGLGDSPHDSLWRNNDLWENCRASSEKAGS